MFDRRQFLMGSTAAGALTLGGCAVPIASSLGSGDAAAQARALYDAIFERMLETSPEMATGLGLDTGARAHLRTRLIDLSTQGKLRAYRPMVEALPRLRQIDRAALSPREAAWLDTVIWVGERFSEAATFPYGGVGGYNYPIPYVLSQLTGSYQEVPDFLDSQHKVETAADAEAYLSRLGDFARNVNREVDHARADAGRGVVPPPFIIDKALTQTRTLRGESGAASGLVQSLVRRTREKGIAGDWGGRAAAIVDGPLASALDRQIAALTELRGRGGAVGASNLPDGERF